VEKDAKIIWISGLSIVLVAGIVLFMKYKQHLASAVVVNQGGQVCDSPGVDLLVCKFSHGLKANCQPLDIVKSTVAQKQAVKSANRIAVCCSKIQAG